ncbi:MAG: YceI family protein [Paludibacter sp.]|nr:YceI family protein [Paludibacter sp.]
MKRRLFILQFLFFAFNSILCAQSFYSVYLQKNSSITINGTTNLVSFKLYQYGDKLAKRDFVISAIQNQNKIVLSKNEQTILVKNFDSNNKMALRDFKKLVKADIYPDIHVKLNYFEIDPKSNTSDLSKANVSVDFTITGKTKKYNIAVKSNREGDFYVLNGNEKINIRDFGLDPPTEMLGLIRVNEWIDIDFNIICKITSNKDSQVLLSASDIK